MRSGPDDRRRLLLFVAGDEPNSQRARHNLRRLESEIGLGYFDIEVVDVLDDFTSAIEHSILVTPALVVQGEETDVTILGDLSDSQRVLDALGFSRQQERA